MVSIEMLIQPNEKQHKWNKDIKRQPEGTKREKKIILVALNWKTIAFLVMIAPLVQLKTYFINNKAAKTNEQTSVLSTDQINPMEDWQKCC